MDGGNDPVVVNVKLVIRSHNPEQGVGLLGVQAHCLQWSSM